VQFGALDDFERPGAGFGDGRGQGSALVAGVGEDALDEGEEVSRAAVEDEPGAVAVLDVGRMDDDVQQEAERVDEDVPFAARDLLARIVALRVERGAAG
jgi:hypothetical protein